MTAQELLDRVHKVFDGVPEHVSATVGDLKKAFAALLSETEREVEPVAEEAQVVAGEAAAALSGASEGAVAADPAKPPEQQASEAAADAEGHAEG